ncbi:two-component system NtrC family sensor kinase [Oxalobacteraceae bacterium GrIS 1.11]
MAYLKLKIGQRLAFGYGFVILLLIGTTLVGIGKLGILSETTDDALKDKYPNTQMVNELIVELGTLSRAMRNTLIMTEPRQIAQEMSEIGGARRKMAELLAQLNRRVRDPGGQEILQQIGIIASTYNVNQEEFIGLLGQRRLGEAKNLLLVDLNPYQIDYFSALEQLRRHESALMDQASGDIARSYRTARKVMLGLTAFAALLSVAITFYITRSLLRQLGGEPDYATDIARKIAAGDLASEIVLHDRDHASLLFAMKAMRDRLVERSGALHQANTELEQTIKSLLHAQDELVRSEKLAALGALVAGMAHELNTPIGNSLLAASSLVDHNQAFALECAAGVRRSALSEHIAEVEHAGEIVLRNLHRAIDLVASFKQVAVDRASTQGRRFCLNEVVAEIILTLWPTLKKGGVCITHAIPPEIVMHSYPGPLGQVLTNLINNAVLHGFDGKQGGNIHIAGKALEDGRVELTVRDDGIGIAPASLKRIYDPFYTTKLGKGGSGLGLNIVYNMVHGLLGGKIEVESALGRGTCFTLNLPLTVFGPA